MMTDYCCLAMEQAQKHMPDTVHINKTSDGYVIYIHEGHLNADFCLWCGKQVHAPFSKPA